jgi:ADP-ribosylglycohydrolase
MLSAEESDALLDAVQASLSILTLPCVPHPLDRSVYRHGNQQVSPFPSAAVAAATGRQEAAEMNVGALNSEEREKLIDSLSHTSILMDRGIGSLVGMAIGDAVGAPLEFVPAADLGNTKSSFCHKTHSYTNPLNAFKLMEGQWTDDTSMGLCLADSLLYKNNEIRQTSEDEFEAASGDHMQLENTEGSCASSEGNVHQLAVDTVFDGADVRIRFWLWWFTGYNNTRRLEGTPGTSVGLGGNISKSLYAMRSEERPPPVFESDTQDAGNGSLMRLAPVPIAFHTDINLARDVSAASSYTTHPGPIAAEACRFLAHLIVRAIHQDAIMGEEENRKEMASSVSPLKKKWWKPKRFQKQANRPSAVVASLLDRIATEYIQDVLPTRPKSDAVTLLRRLLNSNEPDDGLERNWNWRSNEGLDISGTLARRGNKYNGYPNKAVYFGSFSLDGLAIALYSVRTTLSFDEAIERCVNFCGDADTTAAICGQIAGALYGWRSIGKRFKSNLQKWDDCEVALRAALLVKQGLQREEEQQ